MSYIGGIGYFAGPILGAIVITFLQITLSDVTNAWQLYFGLLFIGFVLFAPAASPGGSCFIGMRCLTANSGVSRRPTGWSRRLWLQASSAR